MIGDPTERYGFSSGSQGRDSDLTLADGATWLGVLGIILVLFGFGMIATPPSPEKSHVQDRPFPIRPADDVHAGR